jgi:hypothetical protein
MKTIILFVIRVLLNQKIFKGLATLSPFIHLPGSAGLLPA